MKSTLIAERVNSLYELVFIILVTGFLGFFYGVYVVFKNTTPNKEF